MACVASLEVKHRKEKTSRLGNNEHKTIFAFHEASKLDAPVENQSKHLATLSLRVLCSQEFQVAKGWWLCTGTLGYSWHLCGGQHRSQSGGTMSCLHELPPEKLFAGFSPGCSFQIQLIRGAPCLDLGKMMKAESVVVGEMSERRGCNRLPCTV